MQITLVQCYLSEPCLDYLLTGNQEPLHKMIIYNSEAFWYYFNGLKMLSCSISRFTPLTALNETVEIHI